MIYADNLKALEDFNPTNETETLQIVFRNIENIEDVRRSLQIIYKKIPEALPVEFLVINKPAEKAKLVESMIHRYMRASFKMNYEIFFEK